MCLIYLVVLSFPPTTCSFSTGRLEFRRLAGEARVSACTGSSSLLAHHYFIMHTYKCHAPISYAPIYICSNDATAVNSASFLLVPDSRCRRVELLLAAIILADLAFWRIDIWSNRSFFGLDESKRIYPASVVCSTMFGIKKKLSALIPSDVSLASPSSIPIRFLLIVVIHTSRQGLTCKTSLQSNGKVGTRLFLLRYLMRTIQAKSRCLAWEGRTGDWPMMMRWVAITLIVLSEPLRTYASLLQRLPNIFAREPESQDVHAGYYADLFELGRHILSSCSASPQIVP